MPTHQRVSVYESLAYCELIWNPYKLLLISLLKTTNTETNMGLLSRAIMVISLIPSTHILRVMEEALGIHCLRMRQITAEKRGD